MKNQLRNNLGRGACNKRSILTGLGLASVSVVLTILLLLGLDIYARSRAGGGWNWQGYRGPVMGRKKLGEVRIAVLGGSTAFGYGVTTEHAFPAYLERMLNERVGDLGGRVRKVTVLNLAYNNESSVCFASTLDQYAYLQPDVVLLYSGINDSPHFTYYRKPKACFRNRSIIFQLTGYLPILQLVVHEKYFQLRYGTVDEGYRQRRQRRQRAKRNRQKAITMNPTILSGEKLKEAGYKQYEHYITALIDEVIAQDRVAIFITQPYFDSGSYREWQQERLRRTLERKYGGVDRFRYVTLGELFHRRADQKITWDKVHLTNKGNEQVAQALVEPCLDLIVHFSNP